MNRVGKRIIYISTGISPVLMTKLFFRLAHGRSLNLKQPYYYADKIQWLKLYDYPNNLNVIEAADKFGMRKILAKKT